MVPSDITARYPWTSFILILLFITGPEWLSSVWSLFSNEPLAYAVARKFNMRPLNWSPYWVTVPLGLLMYGYLVHVLKIRQQSSSARQSFVLSIERIISDPDARTKLLFVLWLVLGMWLLGVNSSLMRLRNDVDCLVMPRSLTDEQVTTIGDFLSKNDHHEIVISSVRYDAEAGNYSGDFRRAFEKGGWTVVGVAGVSEDGQEGISLNYTQTMESNAEKSDPKHPKPDALIMQAFRLAHIELDANGGGSGVSITKNVLSLRIGHRRRDRYACTDERRKLQQEHLLERLKALQ